MIEDFNLDLDLNLDFEMEFEGFEFTDDTTTMFDNRYSKPAVARLTKNTQIAYKYASKLADEVNIEADTVQRFMLCGDFIFGDFIEALIVNNDWHVKELTISTLSLSQENVDSLSNLLEGDYVDKLNLICSDFWYAHNKGMLVPYMYEILDKDNKFQFAFARSHTKAVQIETHCGKKIVVSGSANLVSSGCMEFCVIEQDEQSYEFWEEAHKRILERFSTINHNEKKITKFKGLQRREIWEQLKEVKLKKQKHGKRK